MFTYKFTSKALKQIKKLDPATQRKIIRKLDFYCRENPTSFAERLTDYKIGQYRFRVGDHRVIFDLEGKTLRVLKIGHRRSVYR